MFGFQSIVTVSAAFLLKEDKSTPPLSFFMIHPQDAMSALKKGALAQQPEPPLFFYLTVIPILFISFFVQSSLGSSQSCDRHTERRTGYIV